MFAENSRYFETETAEKKINRRKVVYLKRRFIPPADKFYKIRVYTVTEGDRLDNISADNLGDPELFWRIADANNAMKPSDLTDRIGLKLRITLPENITGANIV